MTASEPENTPAPAPTAPDLPPALGGRLHPAAVAVWTVGAVGPLAVFVIVGGAAQGLAAVGLALSALAGVVRWWRFSWRVEGRALVVEQGLLQRRRRVIPLERIQAVDVVRKVRHRLFGVVELRVETVGGTATEGRLDALDPATGERLRAVLLGTAEQSAPRDGAATSGRPATGQVLARLTPGRLVVAGLTGGRVGVAAAVFGVAQDFLGERFERWLPSIDLARDAQSIVVWALVVATGAFVLSVAATMVTYWGFTLSLDGGDVRVRRGLLEQRSDTVPLRRVQAVRLQENLLRRALGLAAVRVDVAGRSAPQEDSEVSGLVLPLGTRAQAAAVAERLVGVPGLAAVRLAPMPRGARDRRLVRAAAVTVAVVAAGVVAAAAGVVTWPPAGVAVVAAGVPAGAAALAAYRSLGWAATDDAVVARRGWAVRSTAFVRRSRLQSLELRQSPFQRRRGLATLALQIARSRGSSDPRLVDLGADEGARLLATLSQPRRDVRRSEPATAPPPVDRSGE